MPATASVSEALERWGAGAIPHPGGTLLAHLGRTAELLQRWGAPGSLVLAGRCHAAYGTDGFAPALLTLDERPVLVDLIGGEAEALVHLYGSCDRSVLNPQLGSSETVRFRDRFDGSLTAMSATDLGPFLELTFANEIDIIDHDPAFRPDDRAQLVELFRRCRPYVSDAAYRAFEELTRADT